MRYIVAIIFIVLLSLMQISCRKDNSTNNTIATIVAKWNLVNDSSGTIGSLNPIYNYSNNYIGAPADYYEFRTNGSVYIKEGINLDTMGYKIDSTVVSFYPQFNSGHYTLNIATLTDSSATLLLGTNPPSGANLTPEGYEIRIINLKK
jgi:hypothetical protein